MSYSGGNEDRLSSLPEELNSSRYPVPPSSVSKWIDKAVKLNVCELLIKVRLFELPLSLFTCKTLTKLSLASTNMRGFVVPSLVILPALKTLDITVKTKVRENLPLPKLPNLKRLELKGFCSRWLLAIQFLETSSTLEHLCIEEPNESYWIEPQRVPTCMLSKLITMKITRCMGRECDIRFLEYMLRNAEVLKTLTITCGILRMRDEMALCARLLKFPRASRHCEIHFVGKWLNSTGN
ncbi:hypothetical protein L2E82_14212 [Cichorium intybus]|uniref:Uncharacterized protein n=1 Tax=Cichorium intybus TaxID=13427 RepID=A0ACB9F062_CICIN|nr:hypothetical protein L2E82_14212 [Cichorium intybus]